MQFNLTPYIWAYFRQGGCTNLGLFEGEGVHDLGRIFSQYLDYIWCVSLRGGEGENNCVLIFAFIFKL